ncbi:MAG: tRNA uridine-5-carboxymethylaminomethyl(34) synthesis GTPase MnmE [Gemmatimonadota bacterium]|nr:tRNA uridine-5-carboxymethylaminomethyl(34) synthesis GTPase MnmE [Gemmatimonadota bacterium]
MRRPDGATDGVSVEAPDGADTIVAVATGAGRAALAVLRISGPAAGDVADRLGLAPLEPRRASLRRLVHPEEGTAIDRVLATLFPAPASYTGEDVLEIGCHGGLLVPQMVLDAACAAGARPARRGEFTRRAYLNGRIDLLQAEATADLIDARSPVAGRVALSQLEGAASRRIEDLRRRLIDLRALVAYEIDFPEEDDGPLDPAREREAVEALLSELGSFLRFAPQGELLREGALTVIAGRPNVGKSSLFNRLLGSERAIVTEHPGTTRDAIEAVVAVEGYPFRLVDTAGLREEADPVERIGIEVARGYVARADLVLLCVEAGRPLDEPERAFLAGLSDGAGCILVRTKADAAPADRSNDALAADALAADDAGEDGNIRVSSTVGTGLEALRQRMLAEAWMGLRESGEAPMVTRRRHLRALRAARSDVEAYRAARASTLPPEVAVTHLRDAATRMEEILGVVDVEDVLDAVFGAFCIGK